MSQFSEPERLLRLLGSAARLDEQLDGELSKDDEISGTHVLRRAEQGIRLFDYQRDLCTQMVSLSRAASGARSLVSLPTGSGKTRTAMAAVLEDLKSASGSRWLWLAPTLELLDQAYGTLVELWRSDPNSRDLEVVVRDHPSPETDVWLTTPQAVNAGASGGLTFQNIVFDEAHQLEAPTFKAAVEKVADSKSSLFGLSATPGRTDSRETEGLVRFFGGNLLTSDLLGKNPVEELQRRGVLSKFAFRIIGTRGQQLDETGRLKAIFHACRTLIDRRRRTLVFTKSVAEAVALSAALQEAGLPAAHVDGRLSEGERRRRIAAFQSGEIKLLLNQRLLATGYDCPAVSDLVLATEVRSPILFEQMVGRAARGPSTGGSSLARIWEFDDHLALHGLPSSYYRYRDYDWA